jgi:hypothetical protein
MHVTFQLRCIVDGNAEPGITTHEDLERATADFEGALLQPATSTSAGVWPPKWPAYAAVTVELLDQRGTVLRTGTRPSRYE